MALMPCKDDPQKQNEVARIDDRIESRYGMVIKNGNKEHHNKTGGKPHNLLVPGGDVRIPDCQDAEESQAADQYNQKHIKYL